MKEPNYLKLILKKSGDKMWWGCRLGSHEHLIWQQHLKEGVMECEQQQMVFWWAVHPAILGQF
jgi:hypothetical protein